MFLIDLGILAGAKAMHDLRREARKREEERIAAMSTDEFERYMRLREVRALEEQADAAKESAREARRANTRRGLFVGRTSY